MIRTIDVQPDHSKFQSSLMSFGETLYTLVTNENGIWNLEFIDYDSLKH